MRLAKYYFTSFLLFVIAWIQVYGQVDDVRQFSYSRNAAPDSITIWYDQDYRLVADSCASILRFGCIDLNTRKFIGQFKDVSKTNPAQVLAEGVYDENGLKNGAFNSYYPNGALQATGKFKDDLFEGKWDFFYPSGKPKLTFIARGNEVKILYTWNEEGNKIVDNGYGIYESIVGPILWKGKLVGGTPDGKWTAERLFIPRSEVLIRETFKLGEFQKGTNQVGDYKDQSRIVLISSDLLPLTRAEKWISATGPCNVGPRIVFTNAWYEKGPEQLAEKIKECLANVFNKIDISPYNQPVELHGKVQKDGRVIFEQPIWTDPKVASALITELHRLPILQPARVEGRVVEQDMIILITFNTNVYRITYRFLPITTSPL